MESLISEKGLCKILTSAYKREGYEVIPVVNEVGRWRRDEIIVNGASWAIRCPTADLPREASVQIVKDAGYLPLDPVDVQKGAPNQMILPEVAKSRYAVLPDEKGAVLEMKRIPVIFRDRWQLYQTEKGDIYAFDIELLKLIDFKTVGESEDFVCLMEESGRLGLFVWREFAVYIAPGKFSHADQEKLLYIAKLDWENQISHADPVVNISLFDQGADVPLAEREE